MLLSRRIVLIIFIFFVFSTILKNEEINLLKNVKIENFIGDNKSHLLDSNNYCLIIISNPFCSSCLKDLLEFLNKSYYNNIYLLECLVNKVGIKEKKIEYTYLKSFGKFNDLFFFYKDSSSLNVIDIKYTPILIYKQNKNISIYSYHQLFSNNPTKDINKEILKTIIAEQKIK